MAALRLPAAPGHASEVEKKGEASGLLEYSDETRAGSEPFEQTRQRPDPTPQ
jgi:hypothetical protein